MSRPPIDLYAEVLLPDGTNRRWSSLARTANDVPQSINFKTRRGDGFADGTLVLPRNIDRDYSDLNLLDGMNLVAGDGSVAYEGRVASIPRSMDDGHSITVQTTGWSSHGKDRKAREIYVDRDFSKWRAPAAARQLTLIGASWGLGSFELTTDTTVGAPALVTTIHDSWNFKQIAEVWYDAAGIIIDGFYYAWNTSSTIDGVGDANWQWGVTLNAADSGAAFSISTGNIRAGGPGTGFLSNPFALSGSFSASKFASIQHEYLTGPAGTAGAEYSIFWTCLALYGATGLTKHGTNSATQAQGFYASDVIRHAFGKYCPKFRLSGIQDTQYVIQQLEFSDPTYPWDIALDVNKFHRWELGVWENRTVYFAPLDMSDYDWEVRLRDPGVTVSLQGDSIGNFGNGIQVTYQDVTTGLTLTIDPTTHSLLADTDPSNPANMHGDSIWPSFSISVPVTTEDAVQIGRAALAQMNQPQGVGEINVNGHIRDRAGNWQPVWKVRAGDRIAITDSTALSDRPRIVGETDYTHPGKMRIAVDSIFQRVDALLDRIQSALDAHNLSSS